MHAPYLTYLNSTSTVTMVESLETLFGKSVRILVKDGEFNEVQGEYHHSQLIKATNNGISHNGRDSCSIRHSGFASSSVAKVDARASGMSSYLKAVVHHQSVLMHSLSYIQIMHLHFIAIPNLRVQFTTTKIHHHTATLLLRVLDKISTHNQETFLHCPQCSPHL